MTISDGARKASKTGRRLSQVVAASAAGTVFEWYDFFIFGSLAALIGRHFFAGVSEAQGYLLALLTFAAGFAVRPFGAIVFGWFGDRTGRKRTFLVTISVMGLATFAVAFLPDYHTIGEFRQRFTEELKGLFLQVLLLCREAGLVRLGHISLDGTKLRANASKHKAMSYGRMLQKEPVLAAEVARWLDEGRREDAAEDAEHGPDDDGWSLPDELQETSRRLAKIREGKSRLEAMARERAVATGDDPAQVEVAERAQTNFTDPESRIMHTPDGFQQCYNAQLAVDAESQVIVACEVSNAPPDVQRLPPMLEQLHAHLGRYPAQLSADAGYASEANFAVLAAAEVHAVIALRRYHRDEPPDADPAPKRASRRWPHRNAMRERLASPEGKALYKLRKQTVEPVFGQIKGARGFRQLLRRGLGPVSAEWALLCTAHNLLKLHQATAQP